MVNNRLLGMHVVGNERHRRSRGAARPRHRQPAAHDRTGRGAGVLRAVKAQNHDGRRRSARLTGRRSVLAFTSSPPRCPTAAIRQGHVVQLMALRHLPPRCSAGDYCASDDSRRPLLDRRHARPRQTVMTRSKKRRPTVDVTSVMQRPNHFDSRVRNSCVSPTAALTQHASPQSPSSPALFAAGEQPTRRAGDGRGGGNARHSDPFFMVDLSCSGKRPFRFSPRQMLGVDLVCLH